MPKPAGYPFTDESDVESLLNSRMAVDDGLQKNLRVIDMQNVVSGYMPANRDDPGVGTTYDGFMDKNGNWYIMQTTTVGNVLTYLYYAGTSGYAAGWAGRIGLSYDIFSIIF